MSEPSHHHAGLDNRNARLNQTDQTEELAAAALDAPPRFVLVSHFLPPSRYGQPRVIQRLLQDLPEDCYSLISVENYDRAIKREDQDGPWLPGPYFKIAPGGVPRFLLRGRLANHALLLNALPAIMARARQIRTLIKENNCRAAIACSGDIADLPATWLACKWTGCKFIAYMFDDYVEQWGFQPRLRALAAFLERRFLKSAASVIVPNEFLRREYVARYGDGVRLDVVNNPWLSEPLVGSPEERSTGPRRVVYTGSIYHVHFDAFRNLSKAVESLGDGVAVDIYSATPAETLEAENIGSFRHCGHVEDRQALVVQRDADILFLPLAFRSTAQAVIKTSAPGKMGEYLASGRPVLVHAPADTFISWYCREHGCAEVVTEPDPGALAQAIRRLLEDGQYRDQLVRNAQRRARQDFSPAVARERFLRVLARS